MFNIYAARTLNQFAWLACKGCCMTRLYAACGSHSCWHGISSGLLPSAYQATCMKAAAILSRNPSAVLDANTATPWADGNDTALQDAAAPALVHGKQHSMTQRASSIKDPGG